MPGVLIAGAIALFTLPSMSFSDDFGDSYTYDFSEARLALSLLGWDWVLWVGGAGVVVAIAAALLLQPDGVQPRKLIMVTGSLAGLMIPVGYYLSDTDLGFGEFPTALGMGPIVFAVACVAAVIVGSLSGR